MCWIVISAFVAWWIVEQFKPSGDFSHQATRDAVFEAIFNNTFQFTGLLKPDGTMLEANKTALDFAGITLEDVKDKKFWDTHWWNYDTAAQERVKAAVGRAAEGTFVRYEDQVQNARGKLVTIDYSLRPVLNKQGQVLYIIPEGRDIQAQINWRKALEASEMRFRAMVNTAKIGVTLLSPEGSVIYANEFSRAMLGGLTENEIKHINLADFTHPDDVAYSYQKLKELQSGQCDAYHLTKRFLTKHNQVVWVQLSVTAVKKGDGSLRYILSVAQDITEQKEVEKQLESSELKYRTLVENSPFGFLIHQDGVVVYANHMAAEIAGLDAPEALLGQNVFDYVASDRKEEAKIRMNEMLETGEPLPEERYTVIDKNGQRKVVEISPSPIMYEGKIAIHLVVNDVTARVQAEENLEKYRQMLEQAERIAHLGSWDWDLTRGESNWSENMFRIFEIEDTSHPPSLEQFLAQVHEEDRGEVEKNLQRQAEGPETVSFAFRLVFPDGRIKHLQSKSFVVRDPNGHDLKRYGSIQDVTAARQAAIKLAQSQAEYEALTNSIPGAVLRYQLRPDGTDRLLFVSRGIEKLFGVSVAEALDNVNVLWDKIVPEDVPPMRASILESARHMKEWVSEWRIQKGKDHIIWVSAKGNPFKADDGSVIWNTVLLDITQQKLAESALKESELRYRNLFHNNLAGVYQFDMQDDYRVVSCNKAFAKILGFDSARQVIGKPLSQLYESLNQAAYLKTITEQGKVINWESKLILHDERIIDTLENSSVVMEKGVPRYLEGTVFDITKLKEAEAERIRLIEQLTFQNKNLQDFAYIVSHNLRSPVASMIGLTQLAQQKQSDPDLIPDVLQRMEQSAVQLDAIIKDLNKVLSIKNNVGKHKEWVDLESLVLNIHQVLKHELDTHKGTLEVDVEEVSSLFAIKGYMHNILYNLIHNGIKYRHPDRPPKICVSTQRVEDGVKLFVRDNGIGVDLAQSGNKMFNLYQRFHHHVNGRGIGLYLVRSQVESMGGQISVESKVGEGTTFYIYFDEDVLQAEESTASNMEQSENKR